MSRVRLRPTTGRRHQLRVTLADLGHPILGDVCYAGDLSTYRLMLHAEALTLRARDGHGGRVARPAAPAAAETPPRTGRRARARARTQQQEHGGDGEKRARRDDVLQPLLRRFTTRADPFVGVLEVSER